MLDLLEFKNLDLGCFDRFLFGIGFWGRVLKQEGGKLLCFSFKKISLSHKIQFLFENVDSLDITFVCFELTFFKIQQSHNQYC